jgi:hypothetical protein
LEDLSVTARKILRGLIERNHLEGLDVDGRTMLKRIFRSWNGDRDWVALV